MRFLGIDVGTGESRALLIDTEGRVRASATVEHAAFASPQTGWAEQDARDWWRAAESAEVVGRVSAAGAAATGLREGTAVVAGAGDQAAGAVGMGVVRPGAVSAAIGTSGVVFATTDNPAFDTGGRVHTFCYAVPARWHVMQGAGLSLR